MDGHASVAHLSVGGRLIWLLGLWGGSSGAYVVDTAMQVLVGHIDREGGEVVHVGGVCGVV